jgi:hypothetical protein
MVPRRGRASARAAPRRGGDRLGGPALRWRRSASSGAGLGGRGPHPHIGRGRAATNSIVTDGACVMFDWAGLTASITSIDCTLEATGPCLTSSCLPTAGTSSRTVSSYPRALGCSASPQRLLGQRGGAACRCVDRHGSHPRPDLQEGRPRPLATKARGSRAVVTSKQRVGIQLHRGRLHAPRDACL